MTRWGRLFVGVFLIPFTSACRSSGADDALSNQNPVAVFSALPERGKAPLTVILDAALSHDPDGAIASYSWDFGDQAIASGPRTTHVYGTAGNYNITLGVTDDDGAQAVDHKTITVDPPAGIRDWPDTSRGIHVFADQLPEGLSAAQIRFAATRMAGTQKMIRREADRLWAVNPDFLVLHYRLGCGLGYRTTTGSCNPTGDWLRIIRGNDWIQEWPTTVTPLENWFFHWPENGAPRVLQCDWGWYLMELNDPSWREFWGQQVAEQLQANDDDGLFLDSLSVPSFLGSGSFSPHLPEVDAGFEKAWADRIAGWLDWIKGGVLSGYHLIVNVGSWITSRDTTRYDEADGVMVEGFVLEADQSPYALEDWKLEMNRILGAVRRNRVLLAQTYATGDQERMYATGCYLLVKGTRSYFTIDIDGVEWWPEYDIPIGSALEEPPAQIDSWDTDGDYVYERLFDNGRVLVNPTNPWDGSGRTVSVELERTCYLVHATGGGDLPESGIPGGSRNYEAVRRITLKPFSAAILLYDNPE